VALVDKKVLYPRIGVIEDSVLLSSDNVIPEHDLIDRVALGRVLGRDVDEQLLGVPVEEAREIGLEIEREREQVVLRRGWRWKSCSDVTAKWTSGFVGIR
jgi:hypothetical protein